MSLAVFIRLINVFVKVNLNHPLGAQGDQAVTKVQRMYHVIALY